MQKEYDLQIAWNIVIELAFVLALWGLTVMNTELLIRWNHIAPEGGQASSWQFGQVSFVFFYLPEVQVPLHVQVPPLRWTLPAPSLGHPDPSSRCATPFPH
jgi:hypothetical protein